MANYVHNVFFTFNDKSEKSLADFSALAHRTLAGHPGELYFAVGPRNPKLDREVNDKEFDIALTIIFKTLEDHDHYQGTQRHDEFRDAISKIPGMAVRVFDSLAV